MEGAVVRTYEEASPFMREEHFGGDTTQEVGGAMLTRDEGRSSSLGGSDSLNNTELGREFERTLEMSFCARVVGELSECRL